MAIVLEKEDALGYVRRRVDPDGTQAERRAFEQQWLTSMGVYAGINFVADGNVIRPPTSFTQQKEAYNANLVLPKVMRFLAKLGSINPKTVVLPNSSTWEDLQSARLATQAYEHAQQVTKFREKKERALLQSVICGSGFMKICWNPARGAPDRIYQNQDGSVNPMVALDARLRAHHDRMGLFTDVYPGELECHVVEPWQMWWDPNARGGGFDDCHWVAVVHARPVDDIYTETGKRIEPDNDSLRGAEVYREIFAFMAAGQSGLAPVVHKPRIKDCTREIEMFVRPSRVYPKGRYIRVAGGTVIADRDNPYAASGSPIPFVKYDAFPCEFRFLGLSLVELMRSPQRAYNQSRSHAMNMQKTAGHAPVFLQKGSGITPVQYPGLHGLILEYNAGFAIPQFGSPPNMPPYIGQNGEIARSEMGEISAQTDPASSKLPGQLRSGSAIQAVQADANLILTPSAKKMMAADEAAGTMMLQLMGMFYDSPRLVTVLGPGGEIDPVFLTGADLRRHYRLKVVAQPGDLDSAESRTAQLMDAAQLGILDPKNPEHAILLLKGLRFHTSDDFVNAMLAQENAEERAIARIIQNPEEPEQVQPWFDPMLRAKLLERRLNSREFETYPPIVQTALAQRWAVFAQMLAERAQAQMEMMAQANGTPAEKGQASKPAS